VFIVAGVEAQMRRILYSTGLTFAAQLVKGIKTTQMLDQV
jgi:hypothetical protein